VVDGLVLLTVAAALGSILCSDPSRPLGWFLVRQ
jgi:hypothetical protein